MCCELSKCVVSCLHVLWAVYMSCLLSTCVVSCLHVLCAVYMCCVLSTCVVYCLHVLWAVYMCCVLSTCVVSCLHVLCAVPMYVMLVLALPVWVQENDHRPILRRLGQDHGWLRSRSAVKVSGQGQGQRTAAWMLPDLEPLQQDSLTCSAQSFAVSLFVYLLQNIKFLLHLLFSRFWA